MADIVAKALERAASRAARVAALDAAKGVADRAQTDPDESIPPPRTFFLLCGFMGLYASFH